MNNGYINDNVKRLQVILGSESDKSKMEAAIFEYVKSHVMESLHIYLPGRDGIARKAAENSVLFFNLGAEWEKVHGEKKTLNKLVK